MTVPTKTKWIRVGVMCCAESCGTCRFKVKGEHRCDIYGDLIPASRGQPGASKRDKRCIAAEVK